MRKRKTMKFSQEDYTITLEDTEVTLLRKEFLLLKFLYKNNERTFSRDELQMNLKVMLKA
jgi:DNA-binding response OmpR family regulator